jgi:hypothetical protein
MVRALSLILPKEEVSVRRADGGIVHVSAGMGSQSMPRLGASFQSRCRQLLIDHRHQSVEPGLVIGFGTRNEDVLRV